MGKSNPTLFSAMEFGCLEGEQAYLVFRELTKVTNHGNYPLTTPVLKVDGSTPEKVDSFSRP